MTNPVRKRRNQQVARVLAANTVTPKPDVGPWEDLTVADCALIRQAVVEHWNPSAASRTRVVDAICETMKSNDDRLCLTAANVIIEMTRQNQNERFAKLREQKRIARQQETLIRQSNRKKKS